MTVNVQKHPKTTCLLRWKFLLQLISYQFNLVCSIIVAFSVIISKKAAVHILTLKIISIVTGYDTIGINNWNHPGFIHFSKLVWQELVADQLVYQTMDNEVAMCFTRVLASNYDYNGFVFIA